MDAQFNYLPRYYQACCVFGGNKILMHGGTLFSSTSSHQELIDSDGLGYDLTWGTQGDIAILETGTSPYSFLVDLCITASVQVSLPAV